jgi:hypothetical protein
MIVKMENLDMEVCLKKKKTKPAAEAEKTLAVALKKGLIRPEKPDVKAAHPHKINIIDLFKKGLLSPFFLLK